MSDVRAYVLWRLKEGVTLSKKDLMYISPGGYTFTNKTGKPICFDFAFSESGYEEKDRLVIGTHAELLHEFITDSLKECKLDELVQEEYGIDFFKEGTIDLTKESNEMYICIDIMIDGKVHEDYDAATIMEPVYMQLYNYNDHDDCVVLLNKLTPEEHLEYVEYAD